MAPGVSSFVNLLEPHRCEAQTNRGMCQATTLRGTPCKCKSKNGTDYCGRHKNHFECSICMTSKTDKSVTKCGHVFCISCIDKWTRDHHTCPICRTQIVEQPPSQPPRRTEIYNRIRAILSNTDSLMNMDSLCNVLNTDEGLEFLMLYPSFKEVFIDRLCEYVYVLSVSHVNIIQSLRLHNIL